MFKPTHFFWYTNQTQLTPGIIIKHNVLGLNVYHMRVINQDIKFSNELSECKWLC